MRTPRAVSGTHTPAAIGWIDLAANQAVRPQLVERREQVAGGAAPPLSAKHWSPQ
jgi:hypothetical protein